MTKWNNWQERTWAEIDLEDTTEEAPALEIESPIEAATAYEGDELSLDEVGEEEEINGLRSFSAKSTPRKNSLRKNSPRTRRENTSIWSMRSISVTRRQPRKSLSRQEPTAQEVPYDEMTLEGPAAEEALFEQSAEEEPMLEVTEDISFDEITFEEAPAVEEAAASEPEPAKPEPEPAKPEPSLLSLEFPSAKRRSVLPRSRLLQRLPELPSRAQLMRRNLMALRRLSPCRCCP